jgi:drug/metabolite transporter (DMT)-like permease
MEHAMQLAEAMTARGFASTRSTVPRQQNQSRLFMLAGVILLAVGWLTQLGDQKKNGWILVALGAGLIIGGLWLLGRQSHRTTYHRPPWCWQDVLSLIVSLCILAILIFPIPGVNHDSLYYDPYPRLTIPSFSPFLGLVLLGFLLPGILGLISLEKETS